MSAIVLSIHPEHVRKILSGEKGYEYRKAIGSRAVERIIIYESRPRKLLVAEAEVLGLITGTPDEVWRRTCARSGVSEQFYGKYYAGRERAFAYELGAVTVYDPPRGIETVGLRRGPQSFVYVEPGKKSEE